MVSQPLFLVRLEVWFVIAFSLEILADDMYQKSNEQQRGLYTDSKLFLHKNVPNGFPSQHIAE